MLYSVYTNKGKVRSDNEDSYLAKLKPYPLFAVADGMGGHRAGDVASKMAVNFLQNYNFKLDSSILDNIKKAIDEVNQEILKEGNENPEYRGMGTTLSMGIIHKNMLYFGHVGDSRIYLYRKEKCKQLSKDHSLVNELLERQKITCSEAFNHPQRNIITQALGTDPQLNIDTGKVELEDGDRLLFCTDGLHDMLRFNEIEKMFNEYSNIDKLSNMLGQLAMNKGGNDNITLIILKIN